MESIVHMLTTGWWEATKLYKNYHKFVFLIRMYNHHQQNLTRDLTDSQKSLQTIFRDA